MQLLLSPTAPLGLPLPHPDAQLPPPPLYAPPPVQDPKQAATALAQACVTLALAHLHSTFLLHISNSCRRYCPMSSCPCQAKFSMTADMCHHRALNGCSSVSVLASKSR